jgi:hypothetical protein
MLSIHRSLKYLWVGLFSVGVAWALATWLIGLFMRPPVTTTASSSLTIVHSNSVELLASLTRYPDCAPVGYSCGHRLLSLAPTERPQPAYLTVWEVKWLNGNSRQPRTVQRLMAVPLSP